MKILGKYSPEEYASFWGADPVYCKPPLERGDGYLFYNFGSEHQERTTEWLTKFSHAIDRTIESVNLRPDTDPEKTEDLTGLNQLKDHIQDLIAEVETA